MPVKTPPLKWHGGKNYLAKWLHSLAPPSVCEDPEHGYTHRNIVCGGGLGEFWNWEPVNGISEAVNDSNVELTRFWIVLQNDDLFADFSRIVSCTPFSQERFEAAQVTKLIDGLLGEEQISDKRMTGLARQAANFFIRYRQSRQGLGKDYATPTRRTRRGMNENVSAWLSAVDGLPECHARLRSVELRNLDAVEFIEKYDHPRALFYCDPPYLHETRSSTGEYGDHEMSEGDHTRLLFKLSRIKGRFMLSGYHSELYDEAAEVAGWQCREREIDNKASSSKTKPKRVECVWTNYEPHRGRA